MVVNPWNCNLIPWWLLIPSGVAGELRRRGGTAPFRELRRAGFMPPGAAFVTGAGLLEFAAVIHVAALNLLWTSSENVVRACVRSALQLASTLGYRSIAFPLIGTGVGGCAPARAEDIICEESSSSSFDGRVVVVRFGA